MSIYQESEKNLRLKLRQKLVSYFQCIHPVEIPTLPVEPWANYLREVYEKSKNIIQDKFSDENLFDDFTRNNFIKSFGEWKESLYESSLNEDNLKRHSLFELSPNNALLAKIQLSESKVQEDVISLRRVTIKHDLLMDTTGPILTTDERVVIKKIKKGKKIRITRIIYGKDLTTLEPMILKYEEKIIDSKEKMENLFEYFTPVKELDLTIKKEWQSIGDENRFGKSMVVDKSIFQIKQESE